MVKWSDLIPVDEVIRHDLLQARRRRGFFPESLPKRQETQHACWHCGGFRDTYQDLCAWKCCVQIFCHDCNRLSAGWGPVDCPCDELGPRGHHTHAEQPRPRRPHKRAVYRMRRYR